MQTPKNGLFFDMENLIYETPRLVSSAFIDSTIRLGTAQTFLMVQDNITECLGRIKCDGVTYGKKYNCFWVFTKVLIHFEQRPDWCDTINTRTFPIDNGGIRTHLNSEAFDKDGALVFSAKYEACVLSFENHRPQKLVNLGYPADNFPSPVFNAQFTRFSASFTEADFVFEQKIRSSFIDLSQHMNNSEYVKLALSTFSNDYLREHDLSEIEAHFTGESVEGQTLRVYRHDVSDIAGDSTFIQIKESERVVFECRITF